MKTLPLYMFCMWSILVLFAEAQNEDTQKENKISKLFTKLKNMNNNNEKADRFVAVKEEAVAVGGDWGDSTTPDTEEKKNEEKQSEVVAETITENAGDQLPEMNVNEVSKESPHLDEITTSNIPDITERSDNHDLLPVLETGGKHIDEINEQIVHTLETPKTIETSDNHDSSPVLESGAAAAAQKAQEDRLAEEAAAVAKKAEEDRLATEAAVAAAKKAEEDRLEEAAVAAVVAQKAEEDRLAAAAKKAEEDRLEEEEAAAAVVAQKAEEDRLAAAAAAAAAKKAEEDRLVEEAIAAKKAEEERLGKRNLAIPDEIKEQIVDVQGDTHLADSTFRITGKDTDIELNSGQYQHKVKKWVENEQDVRLKREKAEKLQKLNRERTERLREMKKRKKPNQAATADSTNTAADSRRGSIYDKYKHLQEETLRRQNEFQERRTTK